MAQTQQINLSESGAVNILDLTLPQNIDAREFDRMNESLEQMVSPRAAAGWVLDLSAVEYTGSAVLGLMVNLRQQVRAGGGKLVLCGVSPRLTEIFRTCSLDRLFTTASSRESAVKMVS